MTPAGLEPAIPGSVGRCLIHWATGPSLPAVDAAASCTELRSPLERQSVQQTQLMDMVFMHEVLKAQARSLLGGQGLDYCQACTDTIQATSYV